MDKTEQEISKLLFLVFKVRTGNETKNYKNNIHFKVNQVCKFFIPLIKCKCL